MSDKPIALRRNGTLYYMHQDQIGNLALVTNGGAPVDAQGFYAYGRLRSGIIGVERSFTGQQKDSGTGLIYFNARYYDPELGTFISPDTLVPDAGNLFAYNRYMYVIGNPLRYNDPTGHDFWDVVDTAVDFAQGVGAQVGYNNTVVAVPSAINVYTPQANESTAMQVGRFVGNVASAVQGGAEMLGGATLGSGGAAACATGVGCLAGAPAVVGGAAVVAHGGTVATIGALNAGAQLGNIYQAVVGGGSGSSTDSLFQSTQVSDKNGFTRSGRALQKHGNRAGSSWSNFLPTGTKNPANYNQQAAKLVQDILNDANITTKSFNSKYYGPVQEYYAPDGRGLRFDSSGNFLGFLEP